MKGNAGWDPVWEDADEALDGVELTDEQLEGIAGGGIEVFMAFADGVMANDKGPAVHTGVRAGANGRRC